MDSGDFRVTQIGDIDGALAFLEVPIITFHFYAIFICILESLANAKILRGQRSWSRFRIQAASPNSMWTLQWGWAY
jgi:hypothetical protein